MAEEDARFQLASTAFVEGGRIPDEYTCKGHNISPPLSWIGILLESVVMPVVYRRVPFITISHSSREDLARIGVSPKRCSVIYCGLDHDQYRPGQAKAQRPSLIYLGRLMHYKRVDMLIRFMIPIAEDHPEAVLHVVGFGPAEDELRRTVDHCGMRGRVVFHGHVSEEEKVSRLQQAWVLVTASMKEGWGLVAVEANACGTPAVAFNVPGLCEAIDHLHSGLLAESEKEFVDAVLRVLEDRGYRDRLSRAALKHAEQFSWDRAAALSLAILSSQIDCSARRANLVLRHQEQR